MRNKAGNHELENPRLKIALLNDFYYIVDTQIVNRGAHEFQ